MSRVDSEAPERTIELGFDPEAVLERDSRVLLDPSFLASLHRELHGELDEAEAAITLLQMGFLHGLQDAHRMLDARPAAGAAAAFAPPLRMPCRPRPAPSAAFDLTGLWPDRREAEAVLSSLGPSDRVRCYLSAGYTSGWLSGTLDAELLAVETSCCAAGARVCEFVAREAAAWREEADPQHLRHLDALPFEAFRELIQARAARRAARSPAEAGGVDRGAAAVHVWGPVMVIPWSGPDATLHTLELIARDAGTSEVSVIVLDLHGALIDEAYGALALEKLVQTSDAWGTEVLLVDASPLSEAVLADLDPQPLLTVKDLEAAVTLAFQIARSQRRAV